MPGRCEEHAGTHRAGRWRNCHLQNPLQVRWLALLALQHIYAQSTARYCSKACQYSIYLRAFLERRWASVAKRTFIGMTDAPNTLGPIHWGMRD